MRVALWRHSTDWSYRRHSAMVAATATAPCLLLYFHERSRQSHVRVPGRQLLLVLAGVESVVRLGTLFGPTFASIGIVNAPLIMLALTVCTFIYQRRAEIALCMGLMTLWRREKVRYLLYWSAGFFFWGIGALLVSQRNGIPDFLTIVVANFVTILSSILFYIGICLFFDWRRSWLPWMYGILSLATALLAYHTYIKFDTSMRIYVYSAAQTLLTLITLRGLLMMARKREKTVNPEIIVVTLLLLISYGSRFIGTMFFPAPQNFLASGNFQTLLAFGMMVIHIAYALAFSNMHAAALNTYLSAALSDAKTKERQKIEVLGYIGHDLRAPLATIGTYSALLLADASEKQRKILQTIQRSVKYQLSLIEELLEYAKSRLHPLAVKPTTTDLHLLLDDISEYAVALCTQKNNTFHYLSPDRLPRQIELDGKRLRQVLLNLISNAAKFTCNGIITLSMSAKQEGEICVLKFSITDTGVGIDLSQSADIFGAFQKVQAASSSTGLGLIIAQGILSAMGESLDVVSAPGNGTTFSFDLSVPVRDTSDSGWFAVSPRDRGSDAQLLTPSLPRDAMPDDQALDELANLAAYGRFTDIENWIEHYASRAVYAPFITHLRELLEKLDFPAINALALHDRNNLNI